MAVSKHKLAFLFFTVNHTQVTVIRKYSVIYTWPNYLELHYFTVVSVLFIYLFFLKGVCGSGEAWRGRAKMKGEVDKCRLSRAVRSIILLFLFIHPCHVDSSPPSRTASACQVIHIPYLHSYHRQQETETQRTGRRAHKQ